MWLYKRYRFFFRSLTKWQWWYWNTKFDWKWFSWCWLIIGNGHQSVQIALCFTSAGFSLLLTHTDTHAHDIFNSLLWFCCFRTLIHSHTNTLNSKQTSPLSSAQFVLTCAMDRGWFLCCIFEIKILKSMIYFVYVESLCKRFSFSSSEWRWHFCRMREKRTEQKHNNKTNQQRK